MLARLLPVAPMTFLLALGACAPASSVGEWSGDLDLTGSTGAPPSSIGGSYAVSAAVAAKPSGDCGVTVDVTGVGTWAVDDGVGCDGGGFDTTLGADQNTALTITDVDEVHVTGTAANRLTLVLGGSAPDWTCTFEGDASRSP